jgi:hypothetical protein
MAKLQAGSLGYNAHLIVRNSIIKISHDGKCNKKENANIVNAIDVFYFVTFSFL